MKRFTSKEEIVFLIDKYTSEMLDLARQAESKDHLADCLRTTEESHRIPRLREAAEKIRSQREWRNGRLRTLGEKLSEFQTPTLPGVGITDTSIPSS